MRGGVPNLPYNQQAEYTRHGSQIVQSETYTLAGLAFFALLGVPAFRRRRTASVD